MNDVYSVDRKQWAQLSILEQMGNIYSEVGRSFNAKRRNDFKSSRAAMCRAIDLFDATIQELAIRKSPRLKEVLRAKDQYLSLLEETPSSDEKIASLDKYFLQFAIAARLQR